MTKRRTHQLAVAAVGVAAMSLLFNLFADHSKIATVAFIGWLLAFTLLVGESDE